MARKAKLKATHPKLDEKSLVRWAADPRIRPMISSALKKPVPLKNIYISGPGGKFIHFSIDSASKFHPNSFRLKSVGSRGTRLLMGCPKGRWDGNR